MTEDTYYEYLQRQFRLATKMELTDGNVIAVLEELLPYIEADGGWLEYVETDYTVDGPYAVSYTHLTLPTNREV